MDKAKQEIVRAEQAKQLLENQMFNEALTNIKAEIFRKFTKTKFDQGDQRDELWRKFQAMEAIEKYLEQVITTGKLASNTLTNNA